MPSFSLTESITLCAGEEIYYVVGSEGLDRIVSLVTGRMKDIWSSFAKESLAGKEPGITVGCDKS